MPDTLPLRPQRSVPDSPLSSSTRFVRRVEKRNLKAAVTSLRRACVFLDKAMAALVPWPDRLQERRGKRSPPALLELARRVNAVLEKARLLLLSGSHELRPLRGQIEQVEEMLLQFGNGVCLSGLFGQSLEAPTRLEAIDLIDKVIGLVKACQVRAETSTKICRDRLGSLESDHVPRAAKTPEQAPETSEGFGSFLSQLQGRGWKVTEKRGKSEESASASRPDALARSHDVVMQISGSYSSLLPDDVDYGLCQFPILLIRETRLSDAVKIVLTSCQLGCEVLTVYGRYTAIKGLFLIGIHRSLMNMVDQAPQQGSNSDPYAIVSPKNHDLGTRLDLGKFHLFLPALAASSEQFALLLKETTPVGRPVRTGKHYYLPLLPNRLASIPDFSLGDWQPLLQQPQPQIH